MRWGGHIARIGENRILVGNPEGRRSVIRPRRRCVENIKKWILREREAEVVWTSGGLL
jgi:hypothetical protein